MFTGIIAKTGRIERLVPVETGLDLTILADWGDYELGESIAVNGICLTVVSYGPGRFVVQASSETLSRTNLGGGRVGSEVHLERALRLSDRLGGHIVSGHVDCTGVIRGVRSSGVSKAITVSAPAKWLCYVVEKGSITIDGASLTVNAVGEDFFEIMLIPHSQSVLMGTFSQVGRCVNLEFDILAKYVSKLLACNGLKHSVIEPRSSSLSLETLRDAGFI